MPTRQKTVPFFLVAMTLLMKCGSDVGTTNNGNNGGGGGGGTYWCTFSVGDPGPITIGQVMINGPYTVNRIEIVEKSTAEILGSCNFGSANSASTGNLPPGYEFTGERSALSSGTTNIKLSSSVANLPMIHAYLVNGDGTPCWETYHEAIVPLNGPGGKVYADPYADKELKIAGTKMFTFKTKLNKDYNFFRDKALKPLLDAGYEAAQKSFAATNPGFIGYIDVTNTLDGRALMEENVILKKWKRLKVEGNKGEYEYLCAYKGTAKGTMTFPSLPSAKVWEVTSEFTFEIDEALSTSETAVYKTTAGTITQTCYTVPNAMPGIMWGDPASFTDTYPIDIGDGYLSVDNGTDPVQYKVSASISASTPLTDKNYTLYTSFAPPESKTLEKGAQEHMWLYSGDAKKSAESDGTMKGTYTWQNGANTYEWTIAPVTE
jgi:hypothetical protein